jgi:sporulation protein YlmC with PRC-barrel domain
MARHQHTPLRRFEPMSRLKDYTVEKGLADPRGWKVLDGAGQEVGQVKDLVIDTDRMAATYLEVELDSKSFAHDDPIILVPMARAERDGSHHRLVVRELSRSRITALFDARAAHEAGFWERWWRDPSPEQSPVIETHEQRPLRPVPRPATPIDDDRPRDLTPEPAVSRIEAERIAARDIDEGRQGLPADAPALDVRRDELSEPDPLEDPHYRRPSDPGDRRRFDE